MDNIERAAQIWCHPKLRGRAMDADMALVISEALRETQEEMASRISSAINSLTLISDKDKKQIVSLIADLKGQ